MFSCKLIMWVELSINDLISITEYLFFDPINRQKMSFNGIKNVTYLKEYWNTDWLIRINF